MVEIGVGTGPNFRYYVRNSGLRVIGVDPNRAMDRYARTAAETAGLLPENFQFLQGVRILGMAPIIVNLLFVIS